MSAGTLTWAVRSKRGDIVAVSFYRKDMVAICFTDDGERVIRARIIEVSKGGKTKGAG